MKYISLFAGVGGFDIALNRLGHECVYANEWDKYCKIAYENYFKHKLDNRDITTVSADEIPDHELLVGGFPCFSKGTLVLTKEGLKEIECVQIGDHVLTHKSRWRRVTRSFTTENKPTREVAGQGILTTTTTDEHPYYAIKRGHIWNNKKRRYERLFGEPEWIESKELKNHFICKNLPPEEDMEGDEDFWWIVGRYIADGWLVNRANRGDGGVARVVISSGRNKAGYCEERIRRKFKCSRVEERTAIKFHITNKEFARFLERFGRGAGNKNLSSTLTLPLPKATALLNGYMSGDGYESSAGEKATTVSKKLAVGLTYLFFKVRGVVPTIFRTTRPRTCIIEGRVVNQRDTYMVQCPVRNRSGFVRDGYGWGLCSKTVATGRNEVVYNIEVEEDNSYTANGCIVHNCQSFSIAGKRRGFEDTRGTLFFEIARILRDKRPRYFILENVKGLLSHDSGKTLSTIFGVLTDIGYEYQWQVLNSKNFGVPQNRERVFIVGHLRGTPRPKVFPITGANREADGENKSTALDANYWKGIDNHGQRTGIMMHPHGTNPGGMKKLPNLRAHSGAIHNELLVSEIIQVNNPTHSNDRVYSQNGISPTLNTMQGGMRQPFVAIPVLTPDRVEKRQNGRRFKEDGDPSFTLTAQDRHGVMISRTVRAGGRGSTDEKHRWDVINDGIQIRRLTPLECQRLQGFPDDFYDGIEMSDTQKYKQMGNAVTVNVVYEVAKRL